MYEFRLVVVNWKRFEFERYSLSERNKMQMKNAYDYGMNQMLQKDQWIVYIMDFNAVVHIIKYC